jgi:hypothetical protein
MTARESEAADIEQVRKANEFLRHCRNIERDARKALANAEKQAKYASERYMAMFSECEARADQRRKAGLIETQPVM